MIALRQSEPSVLKFPSLAEREGKVSPEGLLTLRTYYETYLLPDIGPEAPSASRQSKNSLKEDRIALNHWERITGNPDIRDVTPDHLRLILKSMEATHAEATINKTWRELKAMLEAACEDDVIGKVPKIGRRMKCRLVKEKPKRQRQVVTENELTKVVANVAKATYPHAGRHQFPPAKMWRVALVLFWNYGARTLDFLKHLTWDDIHFQDRLIQFQAQKTSKLQGLPMTENVAAHLRSIRGSSERVFAGFNSPGCLLHKTGKYKRGFYTTWNTEITAGAEITDLNIKHFRERVVTRYNAIHSGLGNWIAGHYMPGVSAQNYDLPTDQIRELICSAPVPKCFEEIW